MVQDGLFVSSVKWHLHFVRFQCLSSVLRVCIFCALCHDIHELSAILNFFTFFAHSSPGAVKDCTPPFQILFPSFHGVGHHGVLFILFGYSVFFVFDVIFLRDHRPLFREAGCLLNR